MNRVNISAPVILAAAGLILALAVADSFEGVDLAMVGWILFGAGVLWGLVVLSISGRKQSVHKTTATTGQQQAPTQQNPGTTQEFTEIENS